METSSHEANILRCLREGMSFDEIARLELGMRSEQVYEIGAQFFDWRFRYMDKSINRYTIFIPRRAYIPHRITGIRSEHAEQDVGSVPIIAVCNR